jgi:hypothetical protein
MVTWLSLPDEPAIAVPAAAMAPTTERAMRRWVG